MAHRPMKRCSASLAIKEMHIKTAMRYHLTSAQMAIVNKSTNNEAGKDVEKRQSFCAVDRNADGAATVENSMEFPQKIKNGTAFRPRDSTAGNIS